MSAFTTFIIGFIVLIIGLGIGAYLLNVPPVWIFAGCVILIGLGIIMATNKTKPKDPPPPSV